jgi:hypothetical protein
MQNAKCQLRIMENLLVHPEALEGCNWVKSVHPPFENLRVINLFYPIKADS